MCAASVCAVALVAAVQAHYAAADTTISSNPQGDWVGTYGGSGYDLAGWSGGDEVSMPGVSVSLVQGSRYQWAAPTADPRALESVDQTTRSAGTYYDSNQIQIRLDFNQAYSGNLALYAVDFDSHWRRETITVGNQTANLSNDFSQGAWITIPINQAANTSLTITATNTGTGPNAVLSGIFLGDGSPSSSAPSNTTLPVVTGTATQGQTLITSDGSWAGSPISYGYQWQDCDSAGNGCANISGATSSSYVLTSGDVGHTIRAVVTATNAGGSTSASSADTAIVAAGPPSNTTPPVVGGSAVQGLTLTTTNGSWTNSPSSYSYQWQDCTTTGCEDISGATSSTYTLQSSDVGSTVDVTVTATNSTGSSSASSAQTATVTASSPPLIGTLLLGDKAVESTQDGGTGTSEAFGYTAVASGTATSTSVYLTSTDGVSVGLYADSSGQPGARLDTGSVSINTAGWVTVPLSGGVSISQGTRYWLAIAATSSTATVTYRDSGNSGSNLDASGNGLANPYSINAHWNSNPASVYLSGIAAPPTPPSNTSAPTISGAAQQGATLTASNGSWTGTTPISYSYQWQDNGQNISGATSQTYAPTASDVENQIDVIVTATNLAGSASATSASVGPVTAPPPPPQNTALPVISGTAQQGATLTTSNGSWTNSPTSYAYQWQDCTTSSCTDITGATSNSYTLQGSDVGDAIDVVVRAKNGGGSAPATSARTATVGASSQYTLPADRTYDWSPGLNAVGGIPHRSSVSATISPSGGDDTATIQSALDNCPTNGVVQLTAGVFHITGQGLSIERSYCTLRGAGPGPGTFTANQPPPDGTTSGTFLVKPPKTAYPAVIIGPRWGGTGGPISLTSDAVRGTKSVTVASTSGLAAGGLVRLDELTDPSISHWNSQDPENNSGWFEEPNRPLGETLEIASISGNMVTFTTDFPITYQVSQSAYVAPVQNVVKYSGIEDLYTYYGDGGDGGGGIHLFSCAYCWVKHVDDSWSGGESINVDNSFRDEIRDSYFHDSQGGLHNSTDSYGVALNWYTSDTLVENNVIIRFNKVDVMRSAGGGNVFGYNYLDDGADLGGQWFETNLNSSHMTTPHYELFEGNEAANFDQDDRWGNSVYVTIFRNHLIGQLRDYPNSGPQRAAGLTQWHWWQSFVGNVLGTPGHPGITGYEAIGGGASGGGNMWMMCWQNNDNVSDGGKCLSTQLRDGNFDYVTGKVHWHGIGGSGQNNGLTPPASSTLPASLYLSSKPAFFGSNPWPSVTGSDAASPLPGQLPARVRYDAGTPNAVQ